MFRVGVEEGTWVKRTCTRFGPFYGRLYTTSDINEARVWTREKDARQFARVVRYRTGTQAQEEKI